ncbi:MAG: FG-GAP-like repeat-containing protein [Flammeovirgaceae bacterium]
MIRIIFSVLICYCVIINSCNAQQATIQVSQAQEITVGVDSAIMQISIQNTGTNTLTNGMLTLQLPIGVAYIPNSVSSTDNQVTELNVTQNNNLQFRTSDILAGTPLVVTLQYQATSQAIAEQLSGAIFRNQIQMTYDQGTDTFVTAAYNILYASLSIIEINPNQITSFSGDTITRTIEIVNGGNGKIDRFQLADVHPSELSWVSSDMGILDDDSLTVADFSSIGNGDSFFDPFERITITQQLVGITCQDKTLSSVIHVFWGEAGNGQTQSSNAHITVDYQTPNIKVTTTPSLSTCFAAEVPSKQEIRLYNNGSGLAKDLELALINAANDTFDPTIFAKIDPASIRYQFEGEGNETLILPVSTTPTNQTNAYACLGTNSIGQVLLNLPDLPPKVTLIVTWDTYRCCITACGADKIMGWRYDLAYQDVCEINTYAKSGKGQEVNINYMTFFTEAPADVYDGEPATYTFTVSSHENNLPQGAGAHYQLVFDLPEGLAWSGNLNDLDYHSGPKTWAASAASFNEGTRQLIVKYPLPAPFPIPKSELNLTLLPNCTGQTDGAELQINLTAQYLADTTCAATCPIPMSCQTLTSSYLHCPLDCSDGGLAFRNYTIQRVSYGQPDNDQNGLPDGNGGLDLSKIKTNRVMVGDTLEAIFTGEVFTSANHVNWAYGYAKTTIPDGNQLSALGAELLIYDASAHTYLSCSEVNVSAQTVGTTRTFSYDFSPNGLAAQCPELVNFQFDQGDSIWLKPKYKVTGNIGGAIKEVTVENDFYLSHLPNPTNSSDQYQCGIRSGRFTLIGYYFAVSGSKNTTISGCSKVITQNFQLSIGDCCSNYEGGNLFPYEYRSWASMQQARVVIPANYTLLNSYMKQRRTRYTNAAVTQTVNPIQPTQIAGDTLWFDLAALYKANGGTLEYSDDGFSGTVYIELAPNCFVPQNTYLDMPWEFTFAKQAILGSGTETLTSAPDRIKFSPRLLSITSSNPKIDGLEKTVTWNARLYTNGSSVNNTWVHIKSPSGAFTIKRVYDQSSGVDFPKVGDIYQIGSLDNQDIAIEASYSNCNYDYITVYAGYECSGYPNNFADFQCTYRTMKLYAEPKPAQTQFRINGKTIGDACSSVVEVEVEIASVQLAVATDLFVAIQVPTTNKMSYLQGSSALMYPLNEPYISVGNPNQSNNTYTFNLQELHSRLADRGLPGVLDLDSSRIKLRFQMQLEQDFKAGDFLLASLRSKAACGQDLPTIHLAYDPNMQFEQQQIPDLNTELNNSWSVNWVDYDNDGFEDLFIPEYESNKPNALYRNNGDGSFTKITEGELVNALGGTVSSTWGDYDNDGDLDVFLANNLQAVNQLYENNGDGSFTQITTGEIANYGGYCHGAAWGDYDNDGYLDLFVADFMPTRFNLLYHNNGDGSFTRITTGIVVTEASNTVGGAWADVDSDGDVDLFVVNTNGQNNALYINEGNGVFEKMTSGHLVNDGANSVGSSWGDYDNDGDLDVFVANASNQDNFLYQNDGNGHFTRITSGVVVNDGGHSHGSAWADLDNDGDLDLIVTNDQDGENFFYANNGDATFSRLDNPMTRDLANSFGTALGDYDNDGDLDLFIANHSNQANQFYKNSRGQCNNWACVRLEGTRSNRSGIGAKVMVKARIYDQEVWQMRAVTTQTGGGAGGQGTMRVLVGLGDATTIDSIRVIWPSGLIQEFTNQPINGCIDVVEENGVLVCGIVYHDQNQNCQQDIEEAVLANQTIIIQPGNKVLSTDAFGKYKTYLDEGEYTIAALPEGNWSQVCPTNQGAHSLTITASDSSHCGLDFGLFSGCPNPDLSVSLSTTALRRGFQNTIAITYQNDGAVTASNVALEVDFGEHIVPLSSDVSWSSMTGTQYTWQLDEIPAGTSKTIYVTDSVSRVAPLGEFAAINASLGNGIADCNSADNVTITSEEIVGSFDPNDKLVFYTGSELGGRLGSGDALIYRIRFQNVGNYYASRVIILDTLSDYLDPSTVTLQGESHQLTKFQNENGILRWEFIGIHLPDSITDEPNSHGFVQFSIRLKDGIPHGSQVHNSAAIQFDYNDFIITNTVSETIFNSSDINRNVLSLNFAPNPMTTHTQVRILSSFDRPYPAPIQEFVIYDPLGRPIKTIQQIDREVVTIDRDSLVAGMYLVKVRDVFGGVYMGRLMVE